MSEFANIDVNDVQGADAYRISVASVRTYRKYTRSYREFCLLRNDVGDDVKRELETFHFSSTNILLKSSDVLFFDKSPFLSHFSSLIGTLSIIILVDFH